MHKLHSALLAMVLAACGGGSGNPDASLADAPNNQIDATAEIDATGGEIDAEETIDATPEIDADDTDAACPACDTDNDGVVDGDDDCPDTAASAVVNPVGCSDAQVDPVLQTSWPPYSLSWTPSGDPGWPG